MISICIPVFNKDITSLHHQLSAQIKGVKRDSCELIIIDDYSAYDYKLINREICRKDVYFELPENAGRSAIRNLFARYSGKKYLLFLDCDSIIENPAFLENYLDVIEQDTQVICGGRIYPKDPPEREKMLRWKYGKLRESKTAAERKKDPYRSFMSNNFLIRRSVFEKIRFDERLRGYGYEDTLFAYSLKQAGIRVDNIENPVINGGLESNSSYLAQTDEAMLNLTDILRSGKYDEKIAEYISILSFYKRVGRNAKSISTAFNILRPLIVSMLSKGYVNLRLYDFYKLGTLNSLQIGAHSKVQNI